ncbi:hypothetical protein QFC19_004094 [Naganishia cerealis]|uniref:Uncharacterized protein n=1 Tax=Naganishia cerealis TaxID=610337 RepID=A0ACC2VXB0_9TREE|nr:hypothetical protein QFC19_004094 [Naganishia cerealis]
MPLKFTSLRLGWKWKRETANVEVSNGSESQKKDVSVARKWTFSGLGNQPTSAYEEVGRSDSAEQQPECHRLTGTGQVAKEEPHSTPFYGPRSTTEIWAESSSIPTNSTREPKTSFWQRVRGTLSLSGTSTVNSQVSRFKNSTADGTVERSTAENMMELGWFPST